MGFKKFGALALAAAVSAQNIDPTSDLDAMGNNTLFNRWRPTSRVISPAGWMNDPCGAMYDNNTGLYHLFYQFHNNHVNWGNISWGHATSKNLVTWEDVGDWRDAGVKALGTGPNGSYDHLGVFSGTAQPVNLHGQNDGTLTLFYTSVHELPTSWTLPYIPGTESQSLATSKDGGKTWQKYENNPVLEHPPPGWNITGWRDPFFHDWPEMDLTLGMKEPHYYAIFGSGIKGVGPRLPLYSAPASDLTNWTYHGALFEVAANTSWGDDATKTGSYGFNFEVAGFFSLTEDEAHGGDGKSVHYYANFGTEGGAVSTHPNNHWALWAEGTVTKRANGSAEFSIIASGVGDFGNLYAVTSFVDTKNKNRRVVWGWSEENMEGYGIKAQGFQGSLGIPREAFVHVAKGVKAPAGGIVKSAETWTEDDSTGLFTVKTLGFAPLPDVVVGLRGGKDAGRCMDERISGFAKINGVESSHFELMASLSDISSGAVAGFAILATPDLEEHTLITYDPATGYLTVNREHSSLIDQFQNTTYSGYFMPYEYEDGPEKLNMHIFVDGSLIEIFINDRFALTTRAYPSREDATGVIAVAKGGSANFEAVDIWYHEVNAFPGRPTNSSSKLVYDTPEETDDYVWWPGY